MGKGAVGSLDSFTLGLPEPLAGKCYWNGVESCGLATPILALGAHSVPVGCAPAYRGRNADGISKQCQNRHSTSARWGIQQAQSRHIRNQSDIRKLPEACGNAKLVLVHAEKLRTAAPWAVEMASLADTEGKSRPAIFSASNPGNGDDDPGVAQALRANPAELSAVARWSALGQIPTVSNWAAIGEDVATTPIVAGNTPCPRSFSAGATPTVACPRRPSLSHTSRQNRRLGLPRWPSVCSGHWADRSD